LGQFDQAVKAFQAAYALAPLPRLLYNIAQAERLDGKCRDALAHYQEYVASESGPHPPDLREKLATVEVCASREASREFSENSVRAVIAVPSSAPPSEEAQPPVVGSAEAHRVVPARKPLISAPVRAGRAPAHSALGATAPSRARERLVSPWVIGSFGGALVSGALGAYFWTRADEARDSLQSVNRPGGTWSPRQESEERAFSRYRSAAIGLGLTAGVLGGVGIVLLAINRHPEVSRSALRINVTQDGIDANARIVF
jgi:hypothetical protein